MEKKFPIEEVRKMFPALKRVHNGQQVVYFDGPGGSQFLESSITAVSQYMRMVLPTSMEIFPQAKKLKHLFKKRKKTLLYYLMHKQTKLPLDPMPLL